MARLTRSQIARVKEAVSSAFTRLRNRLVWGEKKGEKTITFGLGSLYDHAVMTHGGRPESHTRAHLQELATHYLDAYEARAKAQAIAGLQAAIDDRGDGVVDHESVTRDALDPVLKEVSTSVQTLFQTMAQKARAIGSLDGIRTTAERLNDPNPVVAFLVRDDAHCCVECRRLHLLEDNQTPRAWLLSEVGAGYHKKGDPNPKISGCHPNCFTGSQRIHTSGGIRRLDEAFETGDALKVVVDSRVRQKLYPANQHGTPVPGQTWLYRHGSGSSVLEQATPVYDTGEQECVRITLDSGHVLEVSLGHEMWVDDGLTGKRVEAKDLKVGDKVPLLSGAGGFGAANFPVQAELAGNLMGDGSLNGGNACFSFFGDDIPYGERLFHAAQSLEPSGRRFLLRPADGKYSVAHANFSVPARLLGMDLSKKPRRVPREIWTADKETVSAFLRGLYAADGHVEKGGVVLAQNDLDFLREVQILLSNFGLLARVHSHGAAREKEIVYADGRVFQTTRKPCWRLVLGGVDQALLFAEEVGFGHDRKQASLLEAVASSKGGSRKRWVTARVSQIEPIGVQPTFCLTEPKKNTVTVNGVVTGQCRCQMVYIPRGWGFVSGKFAFIAQDYDVRRAQSQ